MTELLLKSAAKKTHASAEFDLGQFYLVKGDAYSGGKAIDCLLAAAEHGCVPVYGAEKQTFRSINFAVGFAVGKVCRHALFTLG